MYVTIGVIMLTVICFAFGEYYLNDQFKKPLPAWLPLVIGTFLVLQFAGLSAWQVSRGLEKRTTQQAFQSESIFTPWYNGMKVSSFQNLSVKGQYLSGQQFVLDNIIINNRYGHYVISPLNVGDNMPLLLVNRGWVEKESGNFDYSRLELINGEVNIHGRAGSLPKAGQRMNKAFDANSDWPKHAIYPSLAEITDALGHKVQPFVLLLDHNEKNGFLRHWVPSEFGPGKHFGYALQWFAMGIILAGLLFWNYRKKRLRA
jgi:cytochrome oxidase assembly protein ShyY1